MASIARRPRLLPLLGQGFRAFFLLAPLAAAGLMAAWIAMWQGAAPMPTGIDPTLWHAHEMIFGFVGAVFAGFLLTAVPNWTGAVPHHGWPVAILALLWIAGRTVMYLPGALSPVLVLVADGAFSWLLLGLIAHDIVRASNRRNLVVVLVLSIWVAANLGFHFGVARGEPQLARTAALLGLHTVAFMVVLIGGRVIPAFTANWMRARSLPSPPVIRPRLERLALPLTAGSGLLLTFAPDSRVSAAVTLLMVLVHGVRLAGWRSSRARAEPLLLVLHVGYLWLICAYLLLAIAIVWPALPASAGLHALTTGGVGTMVLAIMSRAALGHTGRALVAPAPVVAAYLLVSLAALARVLASLLPQLHAELLSASGTLWIIAFVAFFLVYWPILTGPRVDQS